MVELCSITATSKHSNMSFMTLGTLYNGQAPSTTKLWLHIH